MSGLTFHNTLSGRLESFEPIQPGKVGMYVCGITPYDETHLGHARCYVVFDVLKRVLQSRGFEVTHIQNFTDVDDKIIERAGKKNVSPLEYPRAFMDSFRSHMERLNVLPPDRYSLVTTHMPQIVRLVEALVKKDLAYELDGSVYFRVRAFDQGAFPIRYGALSKRNVDELEAGARVEVNEKKNDPLDFALWKKSKAGEPSWPSPWSEGRPGWHIECSAMAMEYLGMEFDIHGGGLDLVFPHHTNEIAQSVGATGARFARVWMHNGFVTVNQQKMSKSLGNFFTLADIFQKFDPMAVRYFLLSQHYRSPLNFSDADLAVADKTWRDRVVGAYRIAERRLGPAAHASADPRREKTLGGERRRAFDDRLAEDLNTAEALGAIHTLCTEIFTADAANANTSDHDWARTFDELRYMLDVLGLSVQAEESWSDEILDLVQERQHARARKDWKVSDQLREALRSKGVSIEDKADGPRLKRI